MGDKDKPKNPEILALENIAKLTEPPNEVLTDLSDLEIITRALYNSFDKNCVPIPTVMTFFEEMGKFRGSLKRQGRKEIIEAFRGLRPVYTLPGYGLPGGEETKNKKSGGGFLNTLLGKEE